MVPAVPGMNGGTYGPERPFPTESFCCGACVCGDSRMSALISVVIPVYNAAGYLDACLQSLQAQTYPDWEAIVVDDGSTDASPDLCRAWAARDSRIRVLRQENAGASAARNAGMDAAQGEYLAFLDSDDRLDPDYLQILFQTLDGTDLAVCGIHGLPHPAAIPAEVVSLDVLRHTPSRYAGLLYINYVFNKLYRRDLICRHDIRFPDQMHRGEDAYFVQEYLLQCRTIAVTPCMLYWYEQHEGSAMRRFYAAVCRDEALLMQRQYDLFHPEGPASLTAGEEEAFQFWQHGKILSVLRYIIRYAPNADIRRRLISDLLREPHAKSCFLQPPRAVGPRARLAAVMYANHCYAAMCWLLCLRR